MIASDDNPDYNQQLGRLSSTKMTHCFVLIQSNLTLEFLDCRSVMLYFCIVVAFFLLTKPVFHHLLIETGEISISELKRSEQERSAL